MNCQIGSRDNYVFKIRFGFQVSEQSSDTTTNVDNTKLVFPTCSQTSPIADVLDDSVVSRLTQGIEVVPLRIDTERTSRFAMLAACSILRGSCRPSGGSPIQPGHHFRPLNPSRATNGWGCTLPAGHDRGMSHTGHDDDHE
jgi:hypothetical protein